MECFAKVSFNPDKFPSARNTYNTSMGDETAKVETAVSALGSLNNLSNDFVLAELASLDRLVNAYDVLPDNPAGTDVEMSDLGVTHQSLGQADSQRRGLKLNVAGLAASELVHDGGLGRRDGIAVLGGLLRRHPPPINHDYTSAKA